MSQVAQPPQSQQFEDELADLRLHGSKALARIFERERPRLLRFVDCRLDPRLYGRLDASDIVQQTFMGAARSLDNYLSSPQVPVYLWIRSIAFGVITEAARFHLATQKRTVEREQRPGAEDRSGRLFVEELSASIASPASAMALIELRGRVSQALEVLSDRDREILTLVHLEMLTTAEAAAELNIDPATARQRHHRAIRRLRSQVERQSPSDP